jgi:hypothetical protein
MREKVTSLTNSGNCAGCHALINPLGFTLENFDTVGRWRTVDNFKPVDSVVQYAAEEGGTFDFRGPRDVAQYAVKSPFAQQAFVRHLFHHLVKQPPEAFGLATVANLRNSFVESGFHIRNLIAEIAFLRASVFPTPVQRTVENASVPLPDNVKR